MDRIVILSIVAMTLLFAYCLWCIDLSVSARMAGDDFVVSGLYFENVSPRVTYHIGMFILSTLWLTMCAIIIWHVVKKERKVAP